MSDIQGAKAVALFSRGGIREVKARTFTIKASGTVCTCEAGQHDRLCYHVRAARLLMAKERADRSGTSTADYIG